MDDYMNYQNMLTTVTTGIAELSSVCSDLTLHDHTENLDQLRKHLQERVFSVGIMGEFRRGKSTVINALLGQEVVPSDIVPCSATLNYVRWGSERYAEIHFRDGSVQRVSVDQLSDYVTKITAESEKMAERVDHAVVYYPCIFCQNGVQVVDTPGLNDDDRMTAISEKVIPTLDAIIMVIVPDSPFGQSEAEFVRNKVMSSDLGRIMFIINKIDQVDEEDRNRLLDNIKERIQTSVLEKMAAVYGKDSPEYENAKSKLGQIRLFPISARNALRSKTRADGQKLRDSGYPEFEAMLSKLLTSDRGLLELIRPINTIQSTAKEALRTIDMRLTAMQMEAADYEKVQQESMDRIKENRKKKKEEIKLLKSKGKTLYADLLQNLGVAYDEIENEVTTYVQQIPVGSEDIENDAAIESFSNRIAPQIDQRIEDVLSIQSERLINAIQNRLGNDVKGLEEFSKELSSDMTGIQTTLALRSDNTGKNSESGFSMALVDSAVIYAGNMLFGEILPGVGAMISGWREHGWKGAAVGGLSGFGLGMGGMLLAAGLGIVGLPLAMIGGLVGAFGGKAAVRCIFGTASQPTSTSAELIRDRLLSATNTTLMELRQSQTLEKWLRDTCEEVYNKVADDIDREWETTLRSMEDSLTQIRIDLEKSISERKNVEADMQAYRKKIHNILQPLKPIYESLQKSLNYTAEASEA